MDQNEYIKGWEPVELTDYDLTREYIDAIHSKVNERFDMLDQHQEIVDKQLANMTVAFGEMSVMIEGLVAALPKESQEIFKTTVIEGRKLMLEVMEGVRNVMENGDPDVRGPMDDLASSDNSDSTNK